MKHGVGIPSEPEIVGQDGSTEQVVVQRSSFEFRCAVKHHSDLVLLWVIDTMMWYIPLYVFVLINCWGFSGVLSA